MSELCELTFIMPSKSKVEPVREVLLVPDFVFCDADERSMSQPTVEWATGMLARHGVPVVSIMRRRGRFLDFYSIGNTDDGPFVYSHTFTRAFIERLINS